MGPDSFASIYGLQEDSIYILDVYTFNAPPFYYLRSSPATDTVHMHTMRQSLSYTMPNNCLNQNTCQVHSSTTATFPVTAYYWDFTNESFTGDSAEWHHFDKAGFRNFSCKILPDFGCRLQTVQQVLFIQPGVIKGGIRPTTPPCIGQMVFIEDSLSFSAISRGGFSRKWIDWAGNEYTTYRMAKQFSKPGDYPVMEIVYSMLDNVNNGCRDTLKANLKIFGLPVFSYDPDTCASFDKPFVALSPIHGLHYLWSNHSTGFTAQFSDSGTYFLTVTDSNLCTYTDSFHLDTCVVPKVILNRNDLQHNPVKVFPNPAQDYLYIQMSGNFVFELYATDGRLVLSESSTANSKILLSGVAAGHYIYRIVANENVFTGRVQVQK